MHNSIRDGAKLWAAAMVALVALVWLYATGFNHQLIFDDTSLLTDVYRLSTLPDLHFGFRKLTEWSFVALKMWLGEGWYWQRVANTALHVANSMLLWLLAFRLICHIGVDVKVASWAAFGGAALWAFNPVGAYAVAYLTQRSTVMATFFVVVVMLSFIEMLRSNALAKRIAWGVFSMGAYMLALMSKEMAAPVLGVLFLIYVFWCRPATKTVMFVGVALGCVLLLYSGGLLSYMQRNLGAAPESQIALYMGPLLQKSPAAAESLYALSLINQLWLYFNYGLLWLLPVPQWMSIDIRTSFPSSVFEFPQMLGVFLWLTLLVAGVWALVKAGPRIRLVGLLSLLPAVFYVSELVFVRVQEPFVLYRSYLWSIALPPIVALGLSLLRFSVLIKAPVLVVLCGVFAFLSLNRVQSMRSELTVWKDAVNKNQGVDYGEMHLGRWRAFLNYGIAELRSGNYAKASQAFEMGRKLGLSDLAYRINQGSALLGAGNPEKAVSVLEPLVGQSGVPAEAYFNLGASYGLIKQTSKSLEAYDAGLSSERLNRNNKIVALFDAAVVAIEAGRWGDAEKYLVELRRVDPSHTFGAIAYANVLFEQGRQSHALSLLAEAIESDPKPELYHGKAVLHFKRGEIASAEENNRLSLVSQPKNPMFLRLKSEIAQKQLR